MIDLNSKYYRSYRENGKRITEIRHKAKVFAQTHFNLADIDKYVDDLIIKAGGVAGFKLVPGYSWATCITVNDGFVHGIPKGTIKPGDLVTIDTGMLYEGTTSDTATTFVIGKPSQEQQRFMDVGIKTLKKTIEKARLGNRVKDLAETIQKNIESAGYSVTRNLTGHGVGKTMHEEPPIPCFLSTDPSLRTKLEVGMVLSIEVMYMAGKWPLKQDDNGWTLRTRDGSDSAVYEDNIIITPKGPEILTGDWIST